MESRIKFQNPEKNSPDVEKVLDYYRAISSKLMQPVKEYVPVKSIVLGRFDSTSSSSVYTVTTQNNKITCTCPGYRFRRHCKHLDLV